ncbi:MAG: hypothetical protein ACRDR6_29915, partial [Pseudonocardiaceae bacterium]
MQRQGGARGRAGPTGRVQGTGPFRGEVAEQPGGGVGTERGGRSQQHHTVDEQRCLDRAQPDQRGG